MRTLPPCSATKARECASRCLSPTFRKLSREWSRGTKVFHHVKSPFDSGGSEARFGSRAPNKRKLVWPIFDRSTVWWQNLESCCGSRRGRVVVVVVVVVVRRRMELKVLKVVVEVVVVGGGEEGDKERLFSHIRSFF